MRPTRDALIRVAGLVLAVLGAIGLAGAGSAFVSFWGAVEKYPFGAASLGLGLVFLVFGFRDGILSAFGIVRPNRINRQVLAWLHAEHYTVTARQDPPEFVYEIRDNNGNGPWVVGMRPIRPAGIQLDGGVKLEESHVTTLQHGTAADFRTLSTRILTAACSVGNLNGMTVNDLRSDPATLRAFVAQFTSVVPAEHLDMTSFLMAIDSVRRATILTARLILDAAAAINERQEGASSDAPTA